MNTARRPSADDDKVTDETHAHTDFRSLLLDASVDGVLAFDAEFRYTAWNSAMERISGMPRGQVLGRVAFEVFPFLVETGEDMYFREALAGRSLVAEARPYDVPESGHRGFFDGYYSPLSDEQGRVVGGVGVIRDITARMQAEEALHASEERYRAFIANSSEGIWRFELEEPVSTGLTADEQIELFYQRGYLAECNDAMARMYGYERAEEIVGARLGDLLVRTDPANVEYLRAFVAAGYRLTDVESVERDREGRLKHFANNLVGVVEGGNILRGWGTQRDVSDRKRAEAERELFLSREQAARLQAEEANRVKDEFLATLSHELRTPLTAILGWAHMLKAGGLDEATARHAVETVERNALAQRQLVEDVLDVSRIVTGKLRIEQSAVNLLDVVRAALDSVRPAAEARRIELQCSFDPRAGKVAGDPSRLQQVVWNLLSNAVKFTPRGGVVRIGVERLLAQTRITVSDTGQGIAPDFLPYVFDRFRQADGSTTREHGGLGLGLAIVRHLVEAHGGSVHAYSTGAGAGATFTVDLPPLPGDPPVEAQVLKAAEQQTDARPADTEDEGDVAPPLVGLSVLLVDDDEDAMEMLAAFLGRGGAEVKTAVSAAAALKELGVRAFDVIVSDIAMPVVDGYDLMRRVRALGEERGGRTPAVALTAYASDADRAQALRAGYQRHLAKPVEPRELLQVIADLAGKAKTR
jgi:PAS domain S-box-containing protein